MGVLKSLFAYVFMFHVLLCSWAPGGLSEFVRIPSLYSHFDQHFVESAGTMTWAGFLALHFANPAHERQDGNRHGALPFHKTTIFIQTYLPASACAPVHYSLCQAVIWLPLSHAEVGEWPGRSVFHPPKTIS